jgi:hypothetical protein
VDDDRHSWNIIPDVLVAIEKVGLIYLVAAIRYRSMIPTLYLLSLVEYLVRAFYIPAYKQIETAGTAPGAAGNLPLAIFSLVMLALSLWPRKPDRVES